MLQRAVRDDQSERLYWSRMHSSDASLDGSPVRHHKPVRVNIVDSIDTIDRWSSLRPLLRPSIYASPGHHLRAQLIEIVMAAGKRWRMSIPASYFETNAGRALLMLTTVHAATKRIHCARQPSGAKKAVVPAFRSLLPAFFWAPLVHRLREGKLWRRFYRQQHRLNTTTYIKCGLARAVKPRQKRYDWEDFVFKTDPQLELLWKDIQQSPSSTHLLALMNVDPRDQQALFS